MFDALKKKFSGWFSSDKKTQNEKEKKPKKESKKASKPAKKEKSKGSEVKIQDKTKITSKEKLQEVKKNKESKIQTVQEVKQVVTEEPSKLEEGESLEEGEEVKEYDETEEIDEQEKEETIEQDEQDGEEPKSEVKEEKKGFFSKFFTKLQSETLSLDQFEELFSELHITLLENNVAFEVVEKIKEALSKKMVGQSIKKGKGEELLIEGLKEAIESVLIEPPDLIDQIKKKKGIYTIIFFGINGTGKTTSIAKLAHKLQKEGISCVLAAADTFRAASIEQIKVHADRLKVPLVAHDYGVDPAAVAFDAKKYAEKNNIKVVLIDTAGRMYTKANLMKEMEKIIRVSEPDLKLFVGESITGNDAIEQAKVFNETAGIDGIILSKADVDEKAGTILSVGYITQKPIYFLGVGQEYKDLQAFKKSIVLQNLGIK